jgi:hypothetical protein
VVVEDKPSIRFLVFVAASSVPRPAGERERERVVVRQWQEGE